ncbi:MAG TPA: hypothetical protein VMS98_03070 [Thermoanaerobaculia bacterium]|nr:hypothetical protein [Thermoanaerobaculia bacterium]
MTKSDTTDFRERLVSLLARHARSGEAGAATSAVARRAYDDLAVVLVPLISRAGFDALVARAFQLAQREYPADAPPGGEGDETEPFAEVGLWLDRQNQRDTIDAAAAMFAVLAALLTTMIGEALTTRYLRKAWPDGFSAGRSKGTQA